MQRSKGSKSSRQDFLLALHPEMIERSVPLTDRRTMNAQYSLPTTLENLGRADRSLEGVRKCILHAVWQAQGKGCSPGAVGVCVGGDRTSGYLHAKEQLFRTIDDVNTDGRLAELEARIMTETPALEFVGVVKQYGALRPLRMTALAVPPRAIVAVKGLDAPAAETFVNLATGATLPDEGEVRVFGRSTAAVSDADEWLT